MLVLGDVHGSDPTHRRALLATYRETDADVALQVGDLEWYDLPTPTWFVAGNNEDQAVVGALRRGESPPGTTNAHLLASDAVDVAGLRVAGLSGNYSPTRYDRDRADLSGGRRRHFTHEDVERALELTDVDVFLTHEAPHGLLVNEDYDVGCKHVDRILETLSPDLCLVGHHHEHAESTFGDTRVVCLAPVWEAHYTLDPETLSLTRHPPVEARK
ncbi:MAG: metallophosphoesterase [Haloferacaceae archaeon]